MTIINPLMLQDANKFRVYYNHVYKGNGDFADGFDLFNWSNYVRKRVPFSVDLNNPRLINTSSPNLTLGCTNITTYIKYFHILTFQFDNWNIQDALKVATVRITYLDSSYDTFPLVAGRNTADWAYERLASYVIPHSFPKDLGYSWRTKQDSDLPYNGRTYYMQVEPNHSKLISTIEFIIEPDVYVGVAVPAVTMELVDIERPTNPLPSDTFWNSSTGKTEYWNGTQWVEGVV